MNRHRVMSRLGYRGLALTMFGAMFAVIGVGVVASHARSLELIHTLLPTWLRVTIWVAAGAAGLVTAWRPRWQWAGFTALFIPPAIRFCSYGWALISGPNLERLAGTALYALLTLTIMLFAAWPEPAEPEGDRDT